MIEVEIKARIENLSQLESILKNEGASFVEEKKQVDIIFGHPDFLDENKMVIEGGVVPRIRKNGETILLEFKQIVRDSGSFEISSPIGDIMQAEKFLEKLGFSRAFAIEKNRKVYKHKDFEICLDDVKHLGFFTEIEKIVEKESDVESEKNECLAMMRSLGIKDGQIEKRKYGDMLQELINNNSINLS